MRKKTSILSISKISLDMNIYPRQFYSQATIRDYSEAMSRGDIFPNICVALYKKKYVLVDGKHRLEAKRLLNEEHIQADIVFDLDEKELLLEAIKRNSKHGKQYSDNDVKKIVKKLRDFGYDKSEIAKIAQVRVDSLEFLMPERFKKSFAVGEDRPLLKPEVSKNWFDAVDKKTKDFSKRKLERKTYMICYEPKMKKIFIETSADLETIKTMLNEGWIVSELAVNISD